MEDEQLAQRLAIDLDASFDEMVLAYQARLYGFALRLTGNAQDAEEIAQDAFVRAYRAMQGYSPDRIGHLTLRPWLYRITLNVARNRGRGRKPRLLPLIEEDGDTPPEISWTLNGAQGDPELLAERGETRDELASLLANLPARYRAAVILRHVAGLSYGEVATVLAQPVGTVKANVHRGVRLLRAELAEDVHRT